MNTREAAIVSTYTGFLVGNFVEMHEYIEEVMGRPVWSHELGDPKIIEEIKAASKKDFIKLEVK